MDVFVLASRWEGMPNAVIEAMALKKPVISSAVGGAIDLIDNEKNGFLIESENVNALTEKIKYLILNHVTATFHSRCCR